MNGSIVWSDAVVIPDAQACSYGGERYEVIRFMQKPADQLDKLEQVQIIELGVEMDVLKLC